MNELELMIQKRDEIQFLDEQILSLLEKRVEAAKGIRNIKKKNNKPSYSPEEKKEKIEKLSNMSSHQGLVEAIWPVIMCYTRTIE